ncbi:hypothetical protein GDO81_017861 [Engystomops pustulosus]|uniref:Ig-like domain-containing protein n=1 Tax=Engystomops pustulosus TaxID=76066 RepID=A0AAV7A2W2_ENGPU|nr:hypothetical protein GDO81_017861 [Engystomops pustulosus]KAG8555918.1 hypothetical protein GDO81_017861 [Engystomops pustulosus]
MDLCIFCFSLLSSLSFTAVLGDIPVCTSKQQVSINEGGKAVLSCLFSQGGLTGNPQVLWMMNTGAQDTVVHEQRWQEPFHNQSAAYVGRTAMYKDWLQRRDATLHVTGVRPVDDGEYSCWIIEASPSLKSSTKCCTTRLYVTKKWKGDIRQAVVACTFYIASLALLLFCLNRCRTQKAPSVNIYEI